MFFRRKKPHHVSFAEYLETLKKLRFNTELDAPQRARVSRDGIAAMVQDTPGGRPQVDKAGLEIGKEIGLLVNGGYQMFWRTPSGKQIPAQSSQFSALHPIPEHLK